MYKTSLMCACACACAWVHACVCCLSTAPVAPSTEETKALMRDMYKKLQKLADSLAYIVE